MSAEDNARGPEADQQAPFVLTRPPEKSRRQTAFVIVAVALGVIVVMVLSALFAAGEDVFGSDPDTIDSYNAEVLESCDLPADSTLVRTYVRRGNTVDGQSYRGMAHLYASPLDVEEVAEFYGLDARDDEARVSDNRSCKFAQRPSLGVISASTASNDFWAPPGAEVRDLAEPPAGTRSFFRLWLAQQETEGVF